jgi:hypothetical protein
MERAFMCWAPEIVDGTPEDGTVGIYKTANAGKARYLCYLNARDAGFALSLTDVRTRRAPEFDACEFRDGTVPRYIEPARTPTEEGS